MHVQKHVCQSQLSRPKGIALLLPRQRGFGAWDGMRGHLSASLKGCVQAWTWLYACSIKLYAHSDLKYYCIIPVFSGSYFLFCLSPWQAQALKFSFKIQGLCKYLTSIQKTILCLFLLSLLKLFYGRFECSSLINLFLLYQWNA